MRLVWIGAAALFAVLLSGCVAEPEEATPDAGTPGAMEVTSSAFDEGARIPERFTCVGRNASPPLTIRNVPEAAEALAIVVEDPDAPGGTFTHWTAWNMAPRTTEVPENADAAALGGAEGINDSGQTGYVGPCPPSGTHRYFFTVYALDERLRLDSGSPPEQAVPEIESHAIAQGVLMGTFSQE